MRCAYVTFLMRGDGYLPGALVLAYALKLQSDHDRVCLVTNDVSRKARQTLGLLYDAVIPVDEQRFKNAPAGGRSDRKMLLTRFQALRLCADGGTGRAYDKIILLDADLLPLHDYDALFQLDTPAGIIMESKTGCYAGGAEGSAKWSWHTLYEPLCPHGARIPKEITDRARRDPSNMGVNAGLWVLAPSMAAYGAVQDALNNPEISKYTDIFPWPEMQLATLLWSGGWTNIDIRYASIGGYPRIDILWGVHYAGLKPWQWKHRSIGHYANYPDFRLWYGFFNSLYFNRAELREHPALQRLWAFSRDKVAG